MVLSLRNEWRLLGGLWNPALELQGVDDSDDAMMATMAMAIATTKMAILMTYDVDADDDESFRFTTPVREPEHRRENFTALSSEPADFCPDYEAL